MPLGAWGYICRGWFGLCTCESLCERSSGMSFVCAVTGLL